MPEAGGLHTGRDQILLDVFADSHGGSQGGAASRALRESLIDDPVDVIRFGPGLARVPRLLAGTFGIPLQERGESVQAGSLGRAKLLNELLDFFLKRGLFPLELRDQRDQFSLGESSNFLAEVL